LRLELENPEALAQRSGIPIGQFGRRVSIYEVPKPTTQSAIGLCGLWKLRFDVAGHDTRWENPLMGWSSGRDTMAGEVSLKFNSKEDAIAYANQHGFEFVVDDTPGFNANPQPKAYATKIRHKKIPVRPEEELL